jgi:hypothetical protein
MQLIAEGAAHVIRSLSAKRRLEFPRLSATDLGLLPPSTESPPASARLRISAAS